MKLRLEVQLPFVFFTYHWVFLLLWWYA